MVLNLLRDVNPTHVAVAFDVSRRTFRTDRFPEYKATRAKTPDEFRSQMELLREIIQALGIIHVERDGYEADDVIATLAREAERSGFHVDICSGDRDCFQLVTDDITVLYPKKGVSELANMTPDAVREKYGLTPEHILTLPPCVAIQVTTCPRFQELVRRPRQSGLAIMARSRA